jgi:hypothetical protein
MLMTIELTHRATYHGPSPFSRDPVEVVEVTVPQALASVRAWVETRL